jgi:hypothetical protein
VIRSIAALAVLGTVIPARAAHADPGRRSPHLDRAIENIDALDYDAARAQLIAALREGGNRRADTVMIHRLAGEISAAFGNADEAAARFRLMLAVDPTAEVAEGQAPKVVEPYDLARAYIDENGALKAHLEREPDGDGGLTLTVVVDTDPLHMVAGAALIDRDSGKVHRAARGSDRLELPVAAGERRSAVVVLVDPHGNHLSEPMAVAPPPRARRPAAVAAAPAPAEPAAPPEPVTEEIIDEGEPPRSGRPVYARWSTWAVAGALAAGTGLWFGMQARSDWDQLDTLIDDSASHDFTEARAIEARGRRNALIGNVALGTGVACGAVSAVLLIHQLRGKRSSGVAVTPARGGGSVAMAWEF